MKSSAKNRISGLVITFNEEKHIQKVIENLDFVDEIIIVDSFSTDQTEAIVKQYPHVKFVQNKFENYTSQRNFTLDLAQFPWILFLDADERIPEKLKTEILETVVKPDAVEAYFFYRKLFYKKKPIHFSGWQTDKNIRLFRKENCRYFEHLKVHEVLNVNGKTSVLKNKLLHYSFDDYASYKAKMIFYGKLKAQELFEKNVKPKIFHFVFKPAYRFLYTYIIRLGFLDGIDGLVICYLNALSVYSRYPELKKLYQNQK